MSVTGFDSAVSYLRVLNNLSNLERSVDRTIAESQLQRVDAAIVDRLEMSAGLNGAGGLFGSAGSIGVGGLPPPSLGLSGAQPGFGLQLGPAGWPGNTVQTAGGFNIFAPGNGGLNIFGPGQSFGETPFMDGLTLGGSFGGSSILPDGTRLLLEELQGILNIVNGMDRTSISNLNSGTPTLGSLTSDGFPWLQQNFGQGLGSQLPLGTPSWQNAFSGACGCGQPSLFQQLENLRNSLLPPCSRTPPKVYVFGNRDYPLSTAASAAKQVDLSKTQAQEFTGDNPNNKFGGVFDKLSPEAQAVNTNYGSMFGKSTVYDENGKLIGVFDTKQLEQMNNDYQLYGTSTAKGKTLKLPDGRSFEIADNAYASPLTFDLAGKGQVGTTDMTHGRNFRMAADGTVTAWAAPGEGILAFGQGKDGSELLGNNTALDGQHFNNGFQALGALATKYLGANVTAKGYLDKNDLEALEQKANLHMIVAGQNGAQDKNERPVEDLGIQQISLKYSEAGANTDAAGNQHREVGAGFVQNGQTKKVDDVWYRYK